MNNNIYKQVRQQLGWNITEAAKRLAITPQYLSRVEKGAQTPSRELVEKMVTTYQAPLVEAELMRREAGIDAGGQPLVSPTSALVGPQIPLENSAVKIDPLKTQVLFSNSIFVSSDPYGIVIDAGQKVGPLNEIQIVSRIGLSLEHAIQLNEALAAHITNLKNFKEI